MTKAQIKARISSFFAVVATEAERIRQVANGAWDQITEAHETAAVRAFLVQQGAGVDYMNRRLPQFLSKDGRVVKFAGVFLHGTPKVRGWTKNKAGKKKLNGECELADLQTVFVYLDSGNTIRQMRCVLFQAKNQPGATQVIGNEDATQRSLYDDCDGFTYVNDTVGAGGEDRRLPKGSSRKRALQYLFVEPRPVITIPSPSSEGKRADYGDHMYRFWETRRA